MLHRTLQIAAIGIATLASGNWSAPKNVPSGRPAPTGFASESMVLPQEDLTKDFNFWLGEWNTEASNAPNWQINHGKDVVQSHLDGKLIEEVFTKDADGKNFQRGYLFYLQRENKWQHTIYDVSWGEYRFLGGPAKNAVGEDVIVLESPDNDTRPGKRRETFANITADSFDYLWEESPDGGKTWQALWKVKYSRAKDAEQKK